MRLKRGEWDGAQPRSYVLTVLKSHGVGVDREAEDWYLLTDADGDVEILHIPNPVLSESITHIYRRFGHLHGFQITDLVRKH